MTKLKDFTVPFASASIRNEEINEVVEVLKSGWLTTGPRVHRFENDFASFIQAPHAVALNSATAALHLALEAIGIKEGDGVIVPTMTFAATAEVVRYFNAEPILCDIQENDGNICLEDAEKRLAVARGNGVTARAIIPVHYAGQMCDMRAVQVFADRHQLSIIEDAAHAFPAFYREKEGDSWEPPGQRSAVACFSFYANKTITTGEGGMATTFNEALATRIRMMSLHGISRDAWKRFTIQGSWYYEIIAPGYKYNLTDIAAAIGIHQLRRAEEMRKHRENVAMEYIDRFKRLEQISPMGCLADRIHSWHLFVVRIKDHGRYNRSWVIDQLKEKGIGTSVHWMPLHMHPFYRELKGYNPEDFPIAKRMYDEIISIPIFSDISSEQVDLVVSTLEGIFR